LRIVWPARGGPAKIAIAVTQNISNLHHPSKPLIDVSSEKSGRPWLLLGAIAAVAGVSATAVTLLFTGGGPLPPPTSNALSAAAAMEEVAADPAPEAPAAGAATARAGGEVVENEETLGALDSLEPVPADGAFHVQVASYKSDADAAEYAATLTARGLPATASVDPSGTSWTLVRLGPFATRGEAEKARFALKLHEREKAYVMPRSNGKYHVQVGSFATREQAEPIAQRLAARGHITKISRIKMGAERWHCVRIGPFDTSEEASDYLALVDLPGSSPVVIPYGPPKL
jgi:cell division protein FtsN